MYISLSNRQQGSFRYAQRRGEDNLITFFRHSSVVSGLHELFALLAPAAPFVAVLPHVVDHLGPLFQELRGVVGDWDWDCRGGGGGSLLVQPPFRGELLGDGALQTGFPWSA